MENTEIFKTSAEKAEALLQFENLEQHRGWQYVVEILKINISLVEKKILKGTGQEQTIEEIRRLRDKIDCYEDLINTPKFMIENLLREEQRQISDDPYE